MDIQIILVAIVFGVAIFYIGRLIYRSIAQKNSSCASGCGKCSANFDNIPSPKK